MRWASKIKELREHPEEKQSPARRKRQAGLRPHTVTSASRSCRSVFTKLSVPGIRCAVHSLTATSRLRRGAEAGRAPRRRHLPGRPRMPRACSAASARSRPGPRSAAHPRNSGALVTAHCLLLALRLACRLLSASFYNLTAHAPQALARPLHWTPFPRNRPSSGKCHTDGRSPTRASSPSLGLLHRFQQLPELPRAPQIFYYLPLLKRTSSLSDWFW